MPVHYETWRYEERASARLLGFTGPAVSLDELDGGGFALLKQRRST
jgi:hypothetical protein